MNILDVHPGKSLKDLGNETVSGFQNTASLIILYFPMFPFDLPENIKPKVLCFQGDQKGTLGRKGLAESVRKELYSKLIFTCQCVYKVLVKVSTPGQVLRLKRVSE